MRTRKYMGMLKTRFDAKQEAGRYYSCTGGLSSIRSVLARRSANVTFQFANSGIGSKGYKSTFIRIRFTNDIRISIFLPIGFDYFPTFVRPSGFTVPILEDRIRKNDF